jgi:hypothetical protein
MTTLTHSQTLEELLRSGLDALEITPAERSLAVNRYTQVAYALRDHWADDPHDGDVYPQGSMRLGTITRNYHRNDEIDIDLVAVRRRTTDTGSKAELKADTGAGLATFVASGPEGSPELDEGKRCWTLSYPGFHLDVLPALPDPDAATLSGILITDRDLLRWQFSDPIAYAAWFHAVMREEYYERRHVVAKQTDIAGLPDWTIKTTLQQAVQALKRHRDIFFTDHRDRRPASIIITTLAALAYRDAAAHAHGTVDLISVLDVITDRMPDYVQRCLGRYVVANPVQSKENFADRWNQHPERAEWFFRWAERARTDFDDLANRSRIDTVITKMAATLGDRVADAAGRGLGQGIVAARHRNSLNYRRGTGMLSTGAITADAGLRHVTRDHSFHGDTGAHP